MFSHGESESKRSFAQKNPGYLQEPRDGHCSVELIIASLAGGQDGTGGLRQVRETHIYGRTEQGHQSP